jgi:hypothetical protein
VDGALIEGDALIPDDVVKGLAAIGSFGMKIAPEYGGLGLSNLYDNRALIIARIAVSSVSYRGHTCRNGRDLMCAAHSFRLRERPDIAQAALTRSLSLGRAMFHNWAVPSPLAVTRTFPSGLKATSFTPSLLAINGGPTC